jgi:hypothetical protein
MGGAAHPARRQASARAARVALLAAALGSAAGAQQSADELPGPALTLDLTSGLVFSDNIERERDPEDGAARFTTDATLTYDTRTRNQRFTAQAGASLEASTDAADGDHAAIDSPFLSLAYLRENRSARLSLDASYREQDNGLSTETADDGSDLIVDQGVRVSTRLGGEIAIGVDGPATYTAALRFNEQRFRDTDDPDLNDQTRVALDQTLALALTPTTRLVFDASYSERDEDDLEETFVTEATVRAGLTARTRSGLTLGARLGVTVREETQTLFGLRATERTEEPVFALSLEQARPNGTVSAELSRRVEGDGARSRLSFGRALDLRRGSLSARIGVTTADTDDELRLFGDLSLSRPFRRGDLTLGVSQSVTSSEDTDVFRTSARIGYVHTLTKLSDISLRMNLSAADSVVETEPDRQRVQIDLAWNRRLTEDWRLSAGYRHLTARESGEPPTIENAIFANVSRRFDLRP